MRGNVGPRWLHRWIGIDRTVANVDSIGFLGPQMLGWKVIKNQQSFFILVKALSRLPDSGHCQVADEAENR
jgi:hypothetical protein